MTTHWLATWVEAHHDELVGVRRHLHTHPELAFEEKATTELLVQRLTDAGLAPRRLPRGTGLVVDVGTGPRTVAVRADIDALPLSDPKDVPYRSAVEGACHACGHDAHAAIGLGIALALAEASELPGRVRVIFQPAEERMAGAREVIAAGELDGVERVFALHCDPRLHVGRIGIKLGPITAACDLVELNVTGPGGHTARPHLTVDVVDALSRIAVDTPALLARRADVRARLLLAWGAIQAGEAANAIPSTGTLKGTVRVLDHAAWAEAEKNLRAIVADVAAACGASAEVHYERGVPPVVNDDACVDLMRTAIAAELGDDAVTRTNTSMGGEDFAWYGEHAPVAMARLGVHNGNAVHDIHQANFDIDERAIGVGVRVLARTALHALA
ncbi:amidohydrolase [Actinobacteria bacterium YIM 96077]|uniref:Amidohydrolase n=1 Tax=Phytoactinopolyspora halophila TaxID=1981511 RepID=A0A329QM11_9ACTN|nr:amidohydrolase [Phytoactinopolyspora halophila]AYY14681.1 amidohydrolase [Actinobacteria bacterium YIM 96077]RAW11608.1 amidohydrolase [Phytoactinopolyspora halophila]